MEFERYFGQFDFNERSKIFYQIASSCRLTEFFLTIPQEEEEFLILHQFDDFFRTSLKDVLYLF